MLAINGETGPPCGVPFVRVSRVPSGISIGAFSQRSTYSRTHFESVWHATARSIRSHGTESKKAFTSRSTNPGRDRPCGRPPGQIPASTASALGSYLGCGRRIGRSARDCLLYTSDAADEEDSVDLGGRRIIKKKKNRY